jgi:hypothetical protein
MQDSHAEVMGKKKIELVRKDDQARRQMESIPTTIAPAPALTIDRPAPLCPAAVTPVDDGVAVPAVPAGETSVEALEADGELGT